MAALAVLRGLAALVILALLPSLASAAPVPFEDVNNNGVYDAGDRDLTVEFASASSDAVGFVTPHSVVIPAGVTVRVGRESGIYITAGRNIIVGGSLTTSSYSSVHLEALGGDITLGPRAVVNGVSSVHLTAGNGTVTVGPGARVMALGASSNAGIVQIAGRRVAFGERARVAASDFGIDVFADEITASPGSTLSTPLGYLFIWATGKAAFSKATLTGYILTVIGSPLSLRSPE